MTDADKLQAAEARIAELSSHIARLEELKSGQIGATIRRGHEAEDVRLCGETVLASTELIARMFEDSFTLRAQLAAMEKERDGEREAGEAAHAKAVAMLDAARAKLTAAAEEAARLRKALRDAIALVRSWHGMGMGEAEPRAWELYQSSPEMRNLTSSLSTPSTGEAVREAVRALRERGIV